MAELGYIPAEIVGGESIWVAAENTAQSSSDIILSNYTPADGYTLVYNFSASTPFTVAAVANGGDTGWTLDVTGTQTLTLSPGRVPFAGIVTHTTTGRTFVVDQGGVVVLASPLRVSQWAAVVAAIDTAMLTVGTNPSGSISVDGMAMTYRTPADLISLRDYAARELRNDTGRRLPRRLLTRFV